METLLEGQLVTVAREGGALDGIVFDTPSPVKVIVAVTDPARGPVLRPFHRGALSERTEANDQDDALRALIRRTPSTQRGGKGAGGGGVQGRRAHTRAATHRTTGR
jgi:hypothetical protein